MFFFKHTGTDARLWSLIDFGADQYQIPYGAHAVQTVKNAPRIVFSPLPILFTSDDFFARQRANAGV